jgi:protein gp37
VRPALRRKCADFYGRRFPTSATVAVDGVRRVGRQQLVDITTTSGTFIAAGLATHNCYALTLAKRLQAMGQAKYQNDGDPRTSGPGFRLTLHPDVVNAPRSWSGSRTVFVNSMSDLFHEDVPLSFIRDVFNVMVETPQHQFQILTKRSKRLRQLAAELPWPANEWPGVSVENQRYSFRVDHLRDVPSAIRFVSAEPLIGPLQLDLSGVDWLIVGGESGAGARPTDPAWVRVLRDDSLAASVAFFFKQWGGRTPKAGGRNLDGRTWDEMPKIKLVSR